MMEAYSLEYYRNQWDSVMETTYLLPYFVFQRLPWQEPHTVPWIISQLLRTEHMCYLTYNSPFTSLDHIQGGRDILYRCLEYFIRPASREEYFIMKQVSNIPWGLSQGMEGYSGMEIGVVLSYMRELLDYCSSPFNNWESLSSEFFYLLLRNWLKIL